MTQMGEAWPADPELRAGLEADVNAHLADSLDERETATRRRDNETRHKLAIEREVAALRLVAAEYEGFRAGIAMVLAELLRRGRD